MSKVVGDGRCVVSGRCNPHDRPCRYDRLCIIRSFSRTEVVLVFTVVVVLRNARIYLHGHCYAVEVLIGRGLFDELAECFETAWIELLCLDEYDFESASLQHCSQSFF